MTSDEYVYIFHHIPKCGGTSMRKAFRKWFRRKRDYRPGWAEGKKLERFRARPWQLEKIKPGTIICGHFEVESIYLHQRYPQVLTDPRYRLITFVREPFSLRLSLLRHEIDHRRLRGDEPIEQLLFDRPNWLCERFPCTADNMEAILDRYFFIGIAEYSQAGFDRLAATLGKPPLRLPRRHKTTPREFPINDELRARFRQVHQLDYRLYELCLNRWRASCPDASLREQTDSW